EHERQEAVTVDAVLELEHLVEVERVPPPERLLDHRLPERALAERLPAAAEDVLGQAAEPHVAELADRADARELAEHQVEERAPAPAHPADVDDLEALAP